MWKYDNRRQIECQNKIFIVKIRYSASVRMSKKDVNDKNAILFRLSSNVKIGFLCQNTIFVLSMLSSIVKIGLWMSNYDIWPQFECLIQVWMSNYNIWPQFECQNGILNAKMWYSASVCMSKYDIRPQFECHNWIFEWQKYDIRPQFQCQNMIFNVKNVIFGHS